MRYTPIVLLNLLILISACKKEEVVCNRFEELQGIYDTDASFEYISDVDTETVYINYYKVEDYKLYVGQLHNPLPSDLTCHFFPRDSFGFTLGIPSFHFANSGFELKEVNQDTFYFMYANDSSIVAKFHPSTDYLWFRGNHCYRRN